MAAQWGSEEDAWGLPLAGRWEVAMGRGVGMVSGVGGVFGDIIEETVGHNGVDVGEVKEVVNGKRLAGFLVGVALHLL